MTENEKPAFMQLWSAVIESYNRKPPSDAALMVVALQLEKYPIGDIKRAIGLHGTDRNNEGFPPTTNDIARLIEGDGKSAGMQAFSKALNSAGRVGAGASVCFDDPIINQVIQDMGGWIAFCMSDEADMKQFKVHEFDKRYRGYMTNFPTDYPRKLIGSEEAYNQLNWPKRKNGLRLIGDFDKAKAVHELPAPTERASSIEYKPEQAVPRLQDTTPRRAPAEVLHLRQSLQPSVDEHQAKIDKDAADKAKVKALLEQSSKKFGGAA